MARAAAAAPSTPELADITRLSAHSKFTEDAFQLVRSGCQGVLCNTREPGEVVIALKLVRDKLNEQNAADNARRARADRKGPYVLVEWDCVRGFTFHDTAKAPIATLQPNPILALNEIMSLPVTEQFGNALVIFHNAHGIAASNPSFRQALQNMMVERHISNRSYRRPLFFVQPVSYLHPDLTQFLQPLPFQPPNEEELASIVDFLYSSYSSLTPDLPKTMDPTLRTPIISSLRGLYRMQAEDALALAIAYSGGFSHDMIGTLRDQKAKLMGASGVMHYIPDSKIPQLHEIVGFDACEPTIRMRAAAYTAEGRQLRLDPPRGIGLVGVPGSGKSQFAKMIARIFQEVCGAAFPTYSINVGAIFGGLVGQTEEQLEGVLARLSAHEGCVAIFDEFEKTLGKSDAGSHETTNRVRGRLLNWMQEERNNTFVVMTMNSIEGIAPEFFRRFDETFYTDLPTPILREKILEVHLSKRGVDPKSLDLEEDDWTTLVNMTDGFVGSELEDVVQNARLYAFHEKEDLPGLEHFTRAINDRKLSIISKSQAGIIDSIRAFCKDIARPATLTAEPRPRNRQRAVG